MHNIPKKKATILKSMAFDLRKSFIVREIFRVFQRVAKNFYIPTRLFVLGLFVCKCDRSRAEYFSHRHRQTKSFVPAAFFLIYFNEILCTYLATFFV